MHIPPMNVPHKLLKELANSFKLGKNTLKTSYGSFKVKPKIIGAALSLNASGDLFPDKVSYKNLSEENKLIFRRFQGNTLKKLTDDMMSTDGVLVANYNKQSISRAAPIFEMKKITEGNWGAHVLNFIIKGKTNYHLKKKKSIDGFLYTLMIIYFHLAKNKDKKGEENPGLPWVSNWNREQLIARMRAEIDGHMVSEQNTFSNLGVFYLCRCCKLTFLLFHGIVKMAETKKKLKEMKKKEKKEEKKKKKKPSSLSKSDPSETEVDFSFESESQEDSKEPRRKQPKRTAKKIESRKRKQILEDSNSQSKSESNDE
ncbi:hypothetical protein Ahy_B05g076797 [Arachis hypogaea]|uniref:Uncharacterized protein n=1 Tax=Arachis hypogaea TaxID=3818 RepID=A0A444Z3Y2_ARAHY|nr:hypothetical protein Ahy_B05g076797 [Arachis hypogaea]